MASRRVVLSWSSGKDSALALHVLRQTPDVEVVGLLTTVNATHDRVAMHAVRRQLLLMQADAAGLPVRIVELVWPSSNDAYERAMRGAIDEMVADGVDALAFGDLFLEDVRAYRETSLAGSGLAPMFPLWGRETSALAREMVDLGIRATLTCVDPRVLPASFAGRELDAALLDELPPDVDRCGERGEFHTFVHAGPMFRAPLAVRTGEVVERDGFVFADVLPVGVTAP